MKNAYEEFGSLVFSDEVMKKLLTKEVYAKYIKIKEEGEELDRKTADAIAEAMKKWALEKGCTHFTHWFLPLTGSTAEKHDAFLDKDDAGKMIIKFTGKNLIKGEPDASSFPSGGLRSTFEARGYTYWDISSPAFIREKVLCIPSVFVSYYGDSLDIKGPLLKSDKLVSKKATELLHKLGYKNVKKVLPSVGLEQEYFLIDRPLYKQRLDLILTGRTLFGHSAPKGQEFEDHYFGAIPTRVQAFMEDVNKELWKLGVYAKTEHNEVAPMQFELAPIFENANMAVDQNQITMDILRRVAYKHGYACLLHEKPFAGINGSGKHNNYSLVSDTGVNVFDMGKDEKDKLKFAAFTSCFIKAVDTYPELLRLTASAPGNDFRLGASEAPPAIISIFLGDYTEDYIKKTVGIKVEEKKAKSKIDSFSYVSTDNTDRNRTSPVAFTGNKFEFRMLGSSMPAAFSNVVLNTIIAKEIDELLTKLDKAKDVKKVVSDYVKEVFDKHCKVVFSGNGYADSWVKEAERRGLPNIKSSIEAIAKFDDKKNVDLLTSMGIFTDVEITSRKEILAEQYVSTISLEAKTMLHMAESYVIPYMVEEIKQYKTIKDESKFAFRRIETISDLLDSLGSKLDELRKDFALVEKEKDVMKKGLAYRKKVVKVLADIREVIDDYEKIASKEVYKLPTYSDMLY